MTNERTFSSTHIYSLAFWAAGLVLVLLELIYGWDTGELGILSAGVGGLVNIKAFLMHMECREKRAFELGEQYERLRSVN